MKELVVISGKGGTGKTTVAAAFAALAERCVIADCDVDAADLHLVLNPEIVRREEFIGGKQAHVQENLCLNCGRCLEVCRFDAIHPVYNGNGGLLRGYQVDPLRCEGCSVCMWFCHGRAIEMVPAVNGEWFVSETRYGPLVHARLGVAEENSGKLVSTVREEAKRIAAERELDWIIVDGSPGIGCPVIASLTGADAVVIVTEPTVSGLHDLERVAQLVRQFQIPGLVSVNKWDINPELTQAMESRAAEMGLSVGARIRYDQAVREAQSQGLPVVEVSRNGCVEDVRGLWRETQAMAGLGADPRPRA